MQAISKKRVVDKIRRAIQFALDQERRNALKKGYGQNTQQKNSWRVQA